jgi:hypothetical protein
MNKRMIGSLAVAALAVGLVAAIAMSGNSPAPKTEEERVANVETMAVTDLADDHKLVGFASDVFLGTVVTKRGTTMAEPLPETQFDVRVLRTVKGSLAGDVVVSQQGGVDEDGTKVVIDNDPLLKVGKTYLFASRTNEATGWHTLIPHYGIVPVSADRTGQALVERFFAAGAAEVPFAAEGPAPAGGPTG